MTFCCAAHSSFTLLALPSRWVVVLRCFATIQTVIACAARLTHLHWYGSKGWRLLRQVWLGYQQSLRACEMGLTLNVDVASTAFIEPQPVPSLALSSSAILLVMLQNAWFTALPALCSSRSCAARAFVLHGRSQRCWHAQPGCQRAC